jgi:GT2 family glycosyltransferase
VILTRSCCDEILKYIDNDVQEVVCGVYSIDGPNSGIFDRLQNSILHYRLTDNAAEKSWGSSSNFLISRDTFERMGGFNEYIQTYKDVEFFTRIKSLGTSI